MINECKEYGFASDMLWWFDSTVSQLVRESWRSYFWLPQILYLKFSNIDFINNLNDNKQHFRRNICSYMGSSTSNETKASQKNQAVMQIELIFRNLIYPSTARRKFKDISELFIYKLQPFTISSFSTNKFKFSTLRLKCAN